MAVAVESYPATTPVRPRRSTYLPGLDGLRALAVGAVLLYHFQAPAIGGFLGVDIFFVISGYLISSQLWSRWSVRGVDLKAFWLGRVRRLFPAVIALIVVSLVLMLLFGRDQLGVFTGDVAAAATYTSNWWYVLHERSYFEASGRPPVLQHLWSLAVEEQFYLLWPLLVLAVLRWVPGMRTRRQVLFLVSVALAGASALVMGLGSAVSHVPEQGDPSRWYFGTDSHASGLLVGAALAFRRGGAGFGRLMPILRPATARATAAGGLALVVLLLMVWRVDEFTTWLYRVGFLFVGLVTAVLIAVVTREGPLQRAFSARLLRYIGQRSYGLYLWHWPVTVFTRPELDVPFTGPRLFMLRLTLTLVAAELSYQLVERPIRTHGFTNPWRALPPRREWAAWPIRQAVVGFLAVALLPSGSVVPSDPGLPEARPSTSQPPGAAQRPSAAATASPTPSTPPPLRPADVVPRPDLSVIVYGDSVALGAQPALVRYAGSVDNRAQEAWHSWVLLPTLAAAAREGRVKADVVILHTGDNGLIPEDQLRAALDALKDIRCVILVTPKVPRSWEARAVATLRQVAPSYPNAVLADWHDYAQGRTAWFVADGIHLTVTGEDAYARFVMSKVTIPAPPRATTTTTPTAR